MAAGIGKKRRRKSSLLRSILPTLLIFVVVLLVFWTGIDQTQSSEQEEALRLARESITRSVLSCYAIEGRYPVDYEYIKENYGVRIDEDRYIIHYEIFASNIMPTITVLEQ